MSTGFLPGCRASRTGRISRISRIGPIGRASPLQFPRELLSLQAPCPEDTVRAPAPTSLVFPSPYTDTDPLFWLDWGIAGLVEFFQAQTDYVVFFYGLAFIILAATCLTLMETLEQLEFPRSLDCDEVRGHFMSRPVPAAEFARQITESDILSSIGILPAA